MMIKGYHTLSVVDLPLSRTTHAYLVQLMSDIPHLDSIIMRTEQFNELVGIGYQEAKALPYYRGVRVFFGEPNAVKKPKLLGSQAGY